MINQLCVLVNNTLPNILTKISDDNWYHQMGLYINPIKYYTMSSLLLDIYHKMLDAYGPQYWWPAESKFEMMVGAILTQSASWRNVEIAISNLKSSNSLSPYKIRNIPDKELARLIYSTGYYNAKALKLKSLSQYIKSQFDDDINNMKHVELEKLRKGLLGVYGIGEETADDILLYALEKPVFVIDSYTKRLIDRLDLSPEENNYSNYSALFTENLPDDIKLFQEYHALIVRHAKETCKKNPICKSCCISQICPTGNGIINM